MANFSQHHRMLPGMKPRPEKIFVDKKDAKENIVSESSATFIFIKGCENYELKVEGKAAKVMCENCANVTISMEKSLVSGTMELLRSRDVFIKLLDSCEAVPFGPVVSNASLMAEKDKYGISKESEKKEYFESPESLSTKLDRLAELVKDSKHAIIFTGAGLSTSTGIPDFRSGMNTVLPTGPGAWELRDRGLKAASRKAKTKSVLKAIPSSSHMAIVQLHQSGIVKMLVSQNTDGLHLRSGMDPSGLAELHGNTNLETCCKCGAMYLRDFRVRTAQKVHDHFTGRFCDESGCRGRLKDSIINFGEDLPEKELSKAYLHSEKADLCIVLGSSLRVTPANEIPREVARHGNLVICNLQKTPLDSKASLVIHALCDDVTSGLMQRLELPIPKWELVRRVKLNVTVIERPNNEKKVKVLVSGLHPRKEIPFSIFEKVVFNIEYDEDKVTKDAVKEPFAIMKIIPMPQQVDLTCQLVFQGHYGEPPVTLKERISALSYAKEFLLYFDPAERTWRKVSK